MSLFSQDLDLRVEDAPEGLSRRRERVRVAFFSLPVPAKNQRFEMSWGNRNDTAADGDVDVALEDVEQGQRVECALSGRIPRGES